MNNSTLLFLLSSYIHKQLTFKKLMNEVTNSYHSMLKNSEIFDLDNLSMYALLSRLMSLRDADSKTTRGEVDQIMSILLGEQSFDHTLMMSIPEANRDRFLLKACDAIQKYQKKGVLCSNEVESLELFSKITIFKIRTITDLFTEQIAQLLKLGYNFSVSDGKMYFRVKRKLFPSENELTEDMFLSRLMQVIDCYTGKVPFYVTIKFYKGASSFNLIS